MFTLHFVFLLVFCVLQNVPAENTVPIQLNGTFLHDQQPASLRNDPSITPVSNASSMQSLEQSTRKEEYEKYLGNEVNDDYDEEEFHDNRLRLMLQPKKSVTLNETKLRIWNAQSDITNSEPIISYRNSFPVNPSVSTRKNNALETSKNEHLTANGIRNDPSIINESSVGTLVTLKNKTNKTAEKVSENPINEKKLPSQNNRTNTDPQDIKVNFPETTAPKGKISNVTVAVGKTVATFSSSKDVSQIQNEVINSIASIAETALPTKQDLLNISKDITEEKFSEQKTLMNVSNSTNKKEKEDKELVETYTQLPPTTIPNVTQSNSEADTFYEELEPDILIDDNDMDYKTANETTDEADTVFIVLPGGEAKQGNQLTQTDGLIAKPYISEDISQNLLHLLMNLTAMTAVNERNGKIILKEIQEQKTQLADLKKQSYSIYNYITKMKTDQPK